MHKEAFVVVVDVVGFDVVEDEVEIDEDEELVVVVAVVDDVEEVGGTVDVDETEEDEELPWFAQGCCDSRSVATYKLSLSGPPQISVPSPLQAILQSPLGAETVPLPVSQNLRVSVLLSKHSNN